MFFVQGEDSNSIQNKKFREKINVTSFFLLRDLYLTLKIMEFSNIKEGELDYIESTKDTKEILEEYIQKSNNVSYVSYFQIDLLSFLYRSKKYNFGLLGNKLLSDNCRIILL